MLRPILVSLFILSHFAASLTSPGIAKAQSTKPVGNALSLPDLVEKIKPSVCTINTYTADDKPLNQGTGFFIGKGRVITNLHVVQGAHRAELKLASGAILPVSGVLADSETHDLVMLAVQIKAPNPLGIPLAKKAPREGVRIVVIGSPLGLERTVSDGIVSSVRDLMGHGKIIQITAAISPGSSGSPVVNMQGQVVAVARSQIVAGQALNFASAVEQVRALKPSGLKTLTQWSSTTFEPQGKDYLLGLKAVLAENYKEALKHFRAAVKSRPQSAVSCFQVAFCLHGLGRYQEAIEAYKQTIRIKADLAEAHNNLGAAYGELGRRQEAITAFKQAIHIKPDFAKAHNNLGAAYGELGRLQEEITEYKQAIRIKPDYAEAHYNLGVANGELGRRQEAITAYKQAIRIKPDFADAHNNLGKAYGELGRRQEAITAYKQAISIKPDYAEAYSNLGVAYGELGRTQDAIEVCKQAIRIKPDYAIAHYNLGWAYLLSDDRGSALDEYKILKDIDRDNANRLFSLIYPK